MKYDYKIADPGELMLEHWRDWLPEIICTEDTDIDDDLHIQIAYTFRDYLGEAAKDITSALATMEEIKNQTIKDMINEDRNAEFVIEILDRVRDTKIYKLIAVLLDLEETLSDEQYIADFQIIDKIQAGVTEQEIGYTESEIYVMNWCEEHNRDFNEIWHNMNKYCDQDDLCRPSFVAESLSYEE